MIDPNPGDVVTWEDILNDNYWHPEPDAGYEIDWINIISARLAFFKKNRPEEYAWLMDIYRRSHGGGYMGQLGSAGKRHLYFLAMRLGINLLATEASERQETVAAAGAPVRIIYGRDLIGPQIAAVANDILLYLLGIWGEGEIDSIEQIRINGKTPEAPVTATHYLGTSTQGVDPTLAAAIAGYSDTLRGTVNGRAVSLAYSVFQVMPSESDGFPRMTAVIKGRKLYDPREPGHDLEDPSTWAWSDNPALALADFIHTFTPDDVDWSTVGAAADYCDELLSDGSKRWTLNLALDNRASAYNWMAVLRTYAQCFLARGPNGWRLAPDRATATSGTLGVGDILEGSMRLRRRTRSQTPNAVKVGYTLAEGDAWGRGEASAMGAGVTSGASAWRESSISLPGVQTYAMAYRHALHRLNAFTLRDLEAEFEVFDSGLKIEPGDVWQITHPIGLTAKAMRIIDCAPSAPGRWRIKAEEYDAAVYTDIVQSEPTTPDTTLASPLSPQPPTGLTLTEEAYRLQTGIWAFRIRVAFTAPASYPFVEGYEIRLKTGGTTVWTATTKTTSYPTPELAPPATYTVEVATLSTAGVTSTFVAGNLSIDGKTAPPGDVVSLTGIEAGGEVRLAWTAVADPDVWRYEVRYGATGGSWATAALLDRVDSLRLTTREIPPGTWRFYVKALDSVGLYSDNAVSVDVAVTADADSYIAGNQAFSSPTLTKMHAFSAVEPAGLMTYWVPDEVANDNEWQDNFPNALNTYTDPLASYHKSLSQQWLSETWDLGLIVSGAWTATFDAVALGTGETISRLMQLSTDNSNWNDYASLSAIASARYARLKATATGTNSLRVKAPPCAIRCDVIAREESGDSTSSASTYKRITLENSYVKAVAVNLTPTFTGGPAARIPVVDNIVMGAVASFDVYIFDAAGAQVAQAFHWQFKGT